MESRKYLCLLAITVILAVVSVSPAQEDTWSTGGPYGASIMDIALHPSDTLRLYIGTVANGIFLTVSSGAEWV